MLLSAQCLVKYCGASQVPRIKTGRPDGRDPNGNSLLPVNFTNLSVASLLFDQHDKWPTCSLGRSLVHFGCTVKARRLSRVLCSNEQTKEEKVFPLLHEQRPKTNHKKVVHACSCSARITRREYLTNTVSLLVKGQEEVDG